jgi:hypothetical protein
MNNFGTLTNTITSKPIRPATEEEWQRYTAWKRDGIRGPFLVDGQFAKIVGGPDAGQVAS